MQFKNEHKAEHYQDEIYAPIEEGIYSFKVVDVKDYPNDWQDKGITVKIEIQDGKYTKRTIFYNITVEGDNTSGRVTKGTNALKGLEMATGIILNHSSELLNKKFIAKLKASKYKDKEGKSKVTYSLSSFLNCLDQTTTNSALSENNYDDKDNDIPF
jgi:hypothetical protein